MWQIGWRLEFAGIELATILDRQYRGEGDSENPLWPRPRIAQIVNLKR